MLKSFTLVIVLGILVLFSCKKEPEYEVRPIDVATENQDASDGKNLPVYTEVPTLVLNNYVNRLFIDLVGREPSDSELVAYTDFLKVSDLSRSSRDSLCRYIQNDLTERPLGRYKDAYCLWLYEKVKARFYIELGKDSDFEGAINEIINDNGDGMDTLDPEFPGPALTEIRKLARVLQSRENFCNGFIGINDMMSYMINNANYDEINMQNVNYVRACFNDLNYRIINNDLMNRYAQSLNRAEVDYVYGLPFTNKTEFAYNLTHSWQFYDGLARWMYLTFLQREPTPDESFQVITHFEDGSDIAKFQAMQRVLLVTDEYARFRYISS